MTASVLPPNATPLEKGFEQAVSTPALPVPLRDLWNPDTCPLDLLPWLAWSLTIPDWSSDWSEPVKRARIRTAIEIHRTKGTLASIKSIVAALGGSISIQEWWQQDPPADPHTFTMVLTASQNGQSASTDYLQALIDEVSRTKPVRSHFEFTIGAHVEGQVGLPAALRTATLARLEMVSTP